MRHPATDMILGGPGLSNSPASSLWSTFNHYEKQIRNIYTQIVKHPHRWICSDDDRLVVTDMYGLGRLVQVQDGTSGCWPCLAELLSLCSHTLPQVETLVLLLTPALERSEGNFQHFVSAHTLHIQTNRLCQAWNHHHLCSSLKMK